MYLLNYRTEQRYNIENTIIIYDVNDKIFTTTSKDVVF